MKSVSCRVIKSLRISPLKRIDDKMRMSSVFPLIFPQFSPLYVTIPIAITVTIRITSL